MELQYHGSGKTFYKETEYKCNLYLNKNEGGILLKIIVNHGHVVGDFLELPFEIDKLPGELNSGFKFVLLRLKRTGMQDFLASGVSEYNFQAEYILYGIDLKRKLTI